MDKVAKAALFVGVVLLTILVGALYIGVYLLYETVFAQVGVVSPLASMLATVITTPLLLGVLFGLLKILGQRK